MLKVAVCGVAGHNRGDDAIALALAEGILAKQPAASISIAMLRRGSIRDTQSIRTFVARRSAPTGLLQLAIQIARSDLVILGGGSLIQDKFGGDRIRGVLGYAWLVSLLARLFGKPLVTAPLGVDDLRSPTAVSVACEILKRCVAVFVRDDRSLQNALTYGGEAIARPLRVCDPAFAIAGAFANAVADDAPIVLAPAFEGEFDDLVADIFARVAEVIRLRIGRPIVVIAMDDRAEEDAGKLSMILDRVPSTASSDISLVTPADLNAAVTLLRGSAGVIAMRLHALILGYGFAPVACLSRTTKTEGFMEDYHVPGLAINAQSDIQACADSLVDAIASWPTRDSQRAIRADRLRELESFYDAILMRAT